jgi:hypothetical protein
METLTTGRHRGGDAYDHTRYPAYGKREGPGWAYGEDVEGEEVHTSLLIKHAPTTLILAMSRLRAFARLGSKQTV